MNMMLRQIIKKRNTFNNVILSNKYIIRRNFINNTNNIRYYSFFSEIKKQFKAELDKNDELKKSIQDIKNIGKKIDHMKNNITKETIDKTNEIKNNLKHQKHNVNEKWEKLIDNNDKNNDTVLNNIKEKTSKTKDNIKNAYENMKIESEKIVDKTPIYNESKTTFINLMNKLDNYKNKYIGKDIKKNIKNNWYDAVAELFGTKQKKRTINQIINPINQDKSNINRQNDENLKKKTTENTMKDEKKKSNAVMIVNEQKSAWERVGARLKETPIIQEILRAAKKAGKTKTGQKIGEKAKYAKDKLGDATEDVREFWETSQNPWIYRISSIYDGLFGETEMGVAIREIRRADPSFILEEWKEDIAEQVIPEVLSAFLRGESRKLKEWCGVGAYNTLNQSIRDRKTEGLVVDPTILAIRNVEVIAAKATDKQAPIIVLQFMSQQINCITNREGEIVEGAEDEVRAVYYALAFQRDYDETLGLLKWKVIEMAMLGALPYV